jgi:hypothetical protein
MNIARYSELRKEKFATLLQHTILFIAFMLCNSNTICFTPYLYILHIHDTNNVIQVSNTVYRAYSFVFSHCATCWYVDDASVYWTNVKVINMGACERSTSSELHVLKCEFITLAMRYMIEQLLVTVESFTRKKMYRKCVGVFINTCKNEFLQSCMYRSLPKREGSQVQFVDKRNNIGGLCLTEKNFKIFRHSQRSALTNC